MVQIQVFFFSPPVAERALSHLPPIQPAPFSTGVRAVDRNVLLQRTLLNGETCSLLQTQTRWGTNLLLCNGLTDLHHHSPAEALLGNRFPALNSSVCSALLYSRERCPFWGLQGQALDVDGYGKPIKLWIKGLILPNQAGWHSWAYV